MTYKIGVFGSAIGSKKEVEENAKLMGREISNHGCILVSGGCKGLPYLASEAAFKNGGETLGYAPARSLDEQKGNNDPIDIFTKLVFIPKDIPFGDDILVRRKYRTVTSCADCDAGIIIGGRMGTLNEFTNLFDMAKVIGVLQGSGGQTDLLPEIIRVANKDSGSIIISDKDPIQLVKRVVDQLK